MTSTAPTVRRTAAVYPTAFVSSEIQREKTFTYLCMLDTPDISWISRRDHRRIKLESRREDKCIHCMSRSETGVAAGGHRRRSIGVLAIL